MNTKMKTNKTRSGIQIGDKIQTQLHDITFNDFNTTNIKVNTEQNPTPPALLLSFFIINTFFPLKNKKNSNMLILLFLKFILFPYSVV